MARKLEKIIAEAKQEAAKAVKPAKKTAPAAPSASAPKKRKTAKKPIKKISKRQQKRDAATSAENLKKLQRRNLVVDLKIGGATVRQISDYLVKAGHQASVGTVQSDLKESLDELVESKTLKTTHWVELEIQRIEKMWFVVWRKFMDESQRFTIFEWIALGNFLNVLQNQRDKYLGLSKALKVDVKMDAREFLAKLTGKKAEDFPAPKSDA